MILQSLVNYYESLNSKGILPAPGWGVLPVNYALDLNDDGTIFQVLSLEKPEERGKKTYYFPSQIIAPMNPVPRTINKRANFLCDNSKYLLGISVEADKKKEQPAKERAIVADFFEEAKRYHQLLLKDMDEPAAKAVLNFFERWNPEKALDDPEVGPLFDQLVKSSNLIFYYDGAAVCNIPSIRAVWDAEYARMEDDGALIRCLVTGKEAHRRDTHPPIKGVPNTKASGAQLVSFNCEAFEQFQKKQGENAPIGYYASFAFSTALNHLISEWRSKPYSPAYSDVVVLSWTEDGTKQYQECSDAFVYNMGDTSLQNDVRSAVNKILQGKPVDWRGIELLPDSKFYILGISGSNARISTRFFLVNTFSSHIARVQAHYDALDIIRPPFINSSYISPWTIVQEAVARKKRASDGGRVDATSLSPGEKDTAERLLQGLLEAIITGGKYPSELLFAVEKRIRTDCIVNYVRAAIIKAYFTRNQNPQCPKEVLQVALNENCTNVPYVLGRLFAVMEATQKAASDGKNTSLVDKYFRAAGATPQTTFAVLGRLMPVYMRKLPEYEKPRFRKLRNEIANMLPETLPARLSLAEQCSFQLGYYHQTEKMYQRKSTNNQEGENTNE